MNLYNFDGDQWFKIYKCLTNKARGAYTYNYDWVLSTISNIFRKKLARIHIYGILEQNSFFYPKKTLDVRFYTAAILLIKIAQNHLNCNCSRRLLLKSELLSCCHCSQCSLHYKNRSIVELVGSSCLMPTLVFLNFDGSCFPSLGCPLDHQ